MAGFLIVIGMLAVFLLFVGITAQRKVKRDIDLSKASQAHFRARSIGNSKMLSGVTDASVRRALRKDSVNGRYLTQLKQANWYWEPGEPAMPNPKAPFWNVETLWGEKIFSALLFSAIGAMMFAFFGVLISLVTRAPLTIFIVLAVGLGLLFGYAAFRSPDNILASAAARRQRELTLEMGYRIPELRADVLAGYTIQRAIRNLALRPGGPFVVELRRAVTILDVTKDDTQAMDQLIDRNDGNELLAEFANSIKMVSRQGGQINPILNVLADQAQQHLLLSIQSQARKNLQEMIRPIGVSSLFVTSLLIIVPAIAGVLTSMSAFAR
jgi:Flp pilus assembly protein TadB